MGVSPLSWSDIAEWRRITGNQLQGWELRAIRHMDLKRVEWMNTPADERKKLTKASPRDVAAAFRSMAAPKKPQPKPKKGAK